MQLTGRPARILGALTLALLLNSPAVQAQDNNAELLKQLERMQQQQELMQQQIEALRKQLEANQAQTVETEAKVEAVAEAIDSGIGTAEKASKIQIAGYGELHYNNLSANDPGKDKEEIDLHRFVLFFGYEFDDKTRFYSELEVEHALAGDGKPGEVELEQAFIEFDLKQNMHAKAGLFLVPVGILNETHEPPTFYGVERNDVENIIIPSTWWEAGVGLNGRWGTDWAWDVALHSGLAMPTTDGNAFRIRSGRQKVAEALASDGAVTGRVRYLGIPGLTAALSLQYQMDPSQEDNDGLDDGLLIEAHADYRRGPFALRALYARWDFSGDAVKQADADVQTGWYIEPSYKLTRKFGVYTRYEDLDGARGQDHFTQWEVGFNYWPHENVVLKFDYRDRSHDFASDRGRDFTGFDIGVGYNF